MEFSTIIFDTAPTGRSLHLLKFTDILNSGLSKLISLKQLLGGLFTQLAGVVSREDGDTM
jgi:arsenite-transporting ATPase